MKRRSLAVLAILVLLLGPLELVRRPDQLGHLAQIVAWLEQMNQTLAASTAW